MPRVPSNVNKPSAHRPGDAKVTKQNAELNRKQARQHTKLTKAHEGAASKVRG